MKVIERTVIQRLVREPWRVRSFAYAVGARTVYEAVVEYQDGTRRRVLQLNARQYAQATASFAAARRLSRETRTRWGWNTARTQPEWAMREDLSK